MNLCIAVATAGMCIAMYKAMLTRASPPQFAFLRVGNELELCVEIDEETCHEEERPGLTFMRCNGATAHADVLRAPCLPYRLHPIHMSTGDADDESKPHALTDSPDSPDDDFTVIFTPRSVKRMHRNYSDVSKIVERAGDYAHEQGSEIARRNAGFRKLVKRALEEKGNPASSQEGLAACPVNPGDGNDPSSESGDYDAINMLAELRKLSKLQIELLSGFVDGFVELGDPVAARFCRKALESQFSEPREKALVGLAHRWVYQR